MKLILIILICMACVGTIQAQKDKTVVYFIPGQGADYRQFKNLQINHSFDTVYLHHFIPGKKWTMKEYAQALSAQIDTTGNYWLVGVSLGGMLATEMADFLNPEGIILLSSAKSRKELPGRYRFQQYIPVYRLVPPDVIKLGSKILQPVVEPDRNKEKETCVAMLKSKNPVFLKRTIRMIMNWERMNYRNDIIHIHGDNDHTIPVRNVKYDYLIEDGSHMMVLTRSDEISELINKILQGHL